MKELLHWAFMHDDGHHKHINVKKKIERSSVWWFFHHLLLPYFHFQFNDYVLYTIFFFDVIHEVVEAEARNFEIIHFIAYFPSMILVMILTDVNRKLKTITTLTTLIGSHYCYYSLVLALATYAIKNHLS